jgi:hypothetical protein
MEVKKIRVICILLIAVCTNWRVMFPDDHLFFKKNRKNIDE